MSVKLRLMRVGKKKQPLYRVVVADSRSPRNGRFIEIIGTYAPGEEPSAIRIDQEKAYKWISVGAQPTETVQKLLKIVGGSEELLSKTKAAKAAQLASKKIDKAAVKVADEK
ncbi:MAG: 30S ribosomal protein S16 [Actinobacteria bacterium]|nr:30S ribosomal protein S16 [Actinomycetota bacterium]MCL6104065.1 30S ribosomal protein S16 [Actinomycetota bacterium]